MSKQKRRLKTAPLILVQLEIQWSQLPSPNVFTPEELSSFHKGMSALGLPDKETINDSYHQIQIGHASPALTETNIIRHIFSNGGSDCHVEITRERLIIRQARYEGIEKLFDLTEKVLDHLNPIEDVSSSVIELISLHHVDIFIPKAGNSLESYIKPKNLLSYRPNIDDSLSVKTTSSSVTLLEKSDERIRDISLRFNVLRFNQGKLSYLLPPELQEPNPLAVMRLHLPAVEDIDKDGEYGVMDIRHAVKFFTKPKFSDFDKLKQLDELYQTSSDTFWKILSDTALKEWEVEYYHV